MAEARLAVEGVTLKSERESDDFNGIATLANVERCTSIRHVNFRVLEVVIVRTNVLFEFLDAWLLKLGS